MDVWIHIKNTHEPLFFKSIIKGMKNIDFKITCRNIDEVVSLLEKYNYKFDLNDIHYGASLFNKLMGQFFRIFRLLVSVDGYDLALSHGCSSSSLASRIRGIPSVSITDNDLFTLDNRSYLPFVDFLIIPKSSNKENFIEMGVKEHKIFQYNGYKEDLYIADFSPDEEFVKNLPFNDYVVVRPEALSTEYVKNKESITGVLLKSLLENGYNIMYLPRSKDSYIPNIALNNENIFIPKIPMNGLDICYYSRAVITGSGTMGREAARIGKTAISFFPEKLLGVDSSLVNEGSLFHTRNVSKIIEYLSQSSDQKPAMLNSIIVKEQIIKKLEEIIYTIK